MDKEIKATLRIEPELYEEVREAANREERSINKELKVLIRRGLEASKQMPLFE